MLYRFSQGVSSLIYVNGVLYGTTASYPNPKLFAHSGSVFAIDATTGAERTLHTFDAATDGHFPFGGLLYENGALYGATGYGGRLDRGTIFKLDPTTGVETLIHSFTTKHGNFVTGLAYRANAIYGVTSSREGQSGTMFRVNINTGAESILHAFSLLSGSIFPSGLIQQGGSFYGTTEAGGWYCGIVNICGGTIFEFTP